MTAPSIVGSIQTINSNGQSGSQSVTVPAGATYCLLLAAYYDDAETGGINTATLNGASFSSVAEIFNSTNFGGTTIWRINNPTTGTFAWSWDMTLNSNYENAAMALVFFQNVDTSGTGIRASATGQGASTATSGSFSSSTNDLCVCIGYSLNTAINGAAGANQTEVADFSNSEDVSNITRGAVGTKPGVAGTTTMAISGNGCSICAVSVLGTSDSTQYTQSVSGAVSPAGAISKRTFRSLTGAISPSGALSAIKTVLLSLSGAISPSGAITRQTRKTLSGAVGPAGAIVKRISRTLGGTLTFKGGYCLRFYGNGTGNIDRVRIPLDTGGVSTPVDVGAGDFTIECWINCLYANNTSASISDARYSNIIIDRDIYGHQRGFVIGVTRRSGPILAACFGVAGASLNWVTQYGTRNVGDGNWHHVALVRRQSTGVIELYVDGALDASGTYTTGDLSYPDGYDPGIGQNNPYIVLGTEKHDVGVGYNGYMDELRISDNRRYTAAFTPQTSQFATDANAMGLYHFNETAGTVLRDSATVSGAPTNGELLVGGSPSGPAWAVSSVFRSLTAVRILIVALSGAISPTGAVVKRTFRGLSGAIGPAGALTKITRKAFSGAISPTGSLSTLRTFLKAISGAIGPSGTLIRQTGKRVNGAISPGGSLVKQITRSLAGAISPSGSLSIIKAFFISLAGAISPSGALVKRTGKSLAGTISPAGGLTKRLARSLAGAISPAGSLNTVRVILKSVGGAISPAGQVVKRTLKGLDGSLSPSGQLTKFTSTALSGVIAPVGAITKRTSRVLSGVLSFLGSVIGVSSGGPPPTVRRVELHLRERTTSLTLEDRSTSLNLPDL